MSQQHRRGFARRGLAAIGVASLALLGLAAGGTAAYATTPPSSAPGNIDPGAKGSIIIHKHEHQSGTSAVQNPAGTGTAIPSAPVADVEFTVYELRKAGGGAIDLTDPAAWNGLSTLTPTAPCTAPSGYQLGAVVDTVETDADGVATADDLPVGAYMVCETDAPASVVDRANPFIVTIPFPFDDEWLYDVNVYPKNGTSTISKTITPQTGLGLGSVVKFPVTAKVPALAPGHSFTGFDITDALDPKLTAVPAGTGNVGLGVLSVTIDGADVPATAYTVGASGSPLSVSFTDFAYLAGQTGKSVVVTFQGTVNAVGTIANQADLYVNDPGHERRITSDPVTTNWGDVVVKKVNAADPAKTLAGAVFEVYASSAPYGTPCTIGSITGSALAVGGATQFTTAGAAGTVTIPGLFVSDSVNPSVSATSRCYVLKEVAAPAGYITPTGDNALRAISVTTGATTGVDVTVTNTQQTGVHLPLTGSTGTAAFLIGGAGIILAAAGASLIAVRRRQGAARK